MQTNASTLILPKVIYRFLKKIQILVAAILDHHYLSAQNKIQWTPAVACDQCEVWYHKSCLGMTSQSYERLNATVSWYCPKCESTNVSTTFFQEWFLDTRNSFAVLDKSVQSTDPVFTPTIHSTPCQTRVKRVVRAPRRQSTRLSDVLSSRSSRSTSPASSQEVFPGSLPRSLVSLRIGIPIAKSDPQLINTWLREKMHTSVTFSKPL